MPLTFSQLKAAILGNAKTNAVCANYHEAQIAANEADLIAAGITIVPFVYQSGVVPDALLAEFNQVNLNAAGVYSSGTFTLTNPAFTEIFILAAAVVTVNFTGNNKLIIHTLGTGAVTINLADNAFAEIKCYNQSTITINAEDTSVACIEINESAAVTANLINDAIMHFTATASSTITLTASNQSYCNARLYQTAAGTYVLNNTATLDYQTFEQSSFTTAV